MCPPLLQDLLKADVFWLSFNNCFLLNVFFFSYCKPNHWAHMRGSMVPCLILMPHTGTDVCCNRFYLVCWLGINSRCTLSRRSPKRGWGRLWCPVTGPRHRRAPASSPHPVSGLLKAPQPDSRSFFFFFFITKVRKSGRRRRRGERQTATAAAGSWRIGVYGLLRNADQIFIRIFFFKKEGKHKVG